MKEQPSNRRLWSRFGGGALSVGALFVAGRASAQGVSDGALAEALFRSAKTLFAAESYAEACPKFAESQRIDPKLGTLMNLALCHEKQGKIASAWAEYTRAATLASRAGQADREQVAHASASAIEPSLPHIVLVAESQEPMKVTLDGEAMGVATLGTAFPIDPGPHTIVASSEGHVPFRRDVTVHVGAGDQTVRIPMLELLPVVVAPPQMKEVPYGHPLVGWALVGGGAVGLVTGSIFGVVAFKEKGAAEGQCGGAVCTGPGLSDVSTMKTAEAVSTLAIGAGIVAAGAGVFFILRSGKHMEAVPRGDQSSVRVGPGPGLAGASLSRTF